MTLELYAFGMTGSIPPNLDKIYNIHLMGVRLFDHNGHTQRVKLQLYKFITKLLTPDTTVRIGIQCQHGKDRSVAMMGELAQLFANDKVNVTTSKWEG